MATTYILMTDQKDIHPKGHVVEMAERQDMRTSLKNVSLWGKHENVLRQRQQGLSMGYF